MTENVLVMGGTRMNRHFKCMNKNYHINLFILKFVKCC